VAGGEVEAVVGAAGVDEAEQGQEPGPGAEALVHGVGVAAGVLAQALVQAADAVVGGPGRLAGHEAAVLGVEQEDEAHEDGEQAAVDLLGVVAGEVAEQLAAGGLVGGLEAAEELEQGAEDLLGEAGGDLVLVLAGLGEQGGEAAVVGLANRRSAPSSMAGRRGSGGRRPRTWRRWGR
jgi:hypothetical protein